MTIVLFILVTALMLIIDISGAILSIISLLLIAFNCYLSAYISTQHDRNNGILQGLKCGAINYLFIVTLSLLIGNFSFTEMLPIKLCLCIFFGVLGGVVGVNTKKTNLKM